MTKVINLFSGPGAGKSTTALSLTAALKINGKICEYVDEAAKTMVYDNRINVLVGEHQDQLYVLAKQNRKLHRLVENKIEWIVSDSPLISGLCYTNPNYFPVYFEKFVFEVFNSYQNVNIFLERTTTYQNWVFNSMRNNHKNLNIC